MSFSSQAWVVEYSFTQGAFSVQTLADAIGVNLHAMLLRERRDFMVVAYAMSKKEADHWKAVLDCRPKRTDPFSEDDIRRIAAELERVSPGQIASPLDLL